MSAETSARFQTIVEFLTEDYFNILLTYSYDVIYRLVVDKSTIILADSGYWKRLDRVGVMQTIRRQRQSLVWLDRITSISIFEFDQVFALTEASINSIFFMLWKAMGKGDILSSWTRDSFNASFNSLKLRLLSNGKVIVYVDILHGSTGGIVCVMYPREVWIDRLTKHDRMNTDTEHAELRAASGSQEIFWISTLETTVVATSDVMRPFEFDRVTLAFEVDLVLATSEQLGLSEEIADALQKSQEHAVLKHLALNFRSASPLLYLIIFC